MSTNTEVQPINLVERRALRDGCSTREARQRAYRQLAIVALGLDVATLTRDLRTRRLQGMPVLRLVPQPDIAA